ncbi:MAG: hypothetical protein ACRDP6_14640 [Actinoallomurus sp.]
MTISRVGQPVAASTAAETSHAFTLPTVLTGDVAIVYVGVVTASAPTVSLPAGWNPDLALVRAGTSSFRMGVWSKVLASGDSGTSVTVTSTVSGQIGIICRVYRGVDAAVYDVAPTSANLGTNDTTPDAPSITPPTNGAMVIAAYGMPTTTNTNWTDWTAPSGLGNAANACPTVASTNNAAIGSADLLQTTAAATGVMTATAGPSGTPQSHAWAAVSAALKPASGAPPSNAGMWGVHL